MRRLLRSGRLRLVAAALALVLIPVGGVATASRADAASNPGGSVVGYAPASTTVLSDGADPVTDPVSSFWVGNCGVDQLDATLAAYCTAPTIQRAQWTFEPLAILDQLAPQDLVSARLIISARQGILDNSTCTPNTLRVYDIDNPVTAPTWASTAAWVAQEPLGSFSAYWGTCAQTPTWTGYDDFDVTALVRRMMSEGRTDLTVGVAGDETNVGSGYNLLDSYAVSVYVNFERPPAAPTDLGIMVGTSLLGCTSTPVAISSPSFQVYAYLTDPDDAVGNGIAGAPVHADLSVVDTTDGSVVASQTAQVVYTPAGAQFPVNAPNLTNGRTYEVRVRTTDGGGLTGPTATCRFTFDGTPPAPPVVTPVLAASTPSVSGKVVAGGTLTAVVGSWTAGTALAYQWRADGVAVAGATGASFVPRSAQVGKKITVTVTGSKAGFASVARTSAATGAVADANVQLGYQGHVQSIGWQPWVTGGQVAGTTGRSLRVEALRFRFNGAAYGGGITATAHVQSIGWMAPVALGGVVGTTGRSLRVEAFTMQLTGEMAQHYDIYYRTHAQHLGWLGWAKDGARSGTAGYAYRLEAVDVRLVPKGDPAPAATTTLASFYQH